MSDGEARMAQKKTCFVVMGFGEKVDFETGRKLNLDATYRNLIKPAIEDAGLECYRADEIVHSGVIDVPMYREILTADVVVADLSTANCNAFYELGVRHALRPYTTIIIAEDKFKFPFDIRQITIRQYKHLGEDIGVSEAKRFTAELKNAVTGILKKEPPDCDSPVYTFLKGLKRPVFPDDKQGAGDGAVTAGGAQAPDQTHSALMQQVDDAQKQGDFAKARALLAAVRAMRPNDPYIVQRLALVTYKDKKQGVKDRFEEARDLLTTLNPATSNDTETLGLWGAVHKRLWDETLERKHLDEAVRGYERGFYLRNDYYNGINFAFMLNVRAAHTSDRAEAVADFVSARRVREEVVSICEEWLQSTVAPDNKASDEAKIEYLKSKYWVVATLAEANLGLGKATEAEKSYREAYSSAPEPWMIDTTKAQREKLEELLGDSPLRYVKAVGE
jgi:tetratricopeptide (TPR) repeat protein